MSYATKIFKKIEDYSMKKRKYPLTLFLFGVLHNLIGHIFLLIPIVILFIIGAFGISVCTSIAIILTCCYIIYAIILQVIIRNALIKDGNNPEFNRLMDEFLGTNDSTDKTAK